MAAKPCRLRRFEFPSACRLESNRTRAMRPGYSRHTSRDPYPEQIRRDRFPCVPACAPL